MPDFWKDAVATAAAAAKRVILMTVGALLCTFPRAYQPWQLVAWESAWLCGHLQLASAPHAAGLLAWCGLVVWLLPHLSADLGY